MDQKRASVVGRPSNHSMTGSVAGGMPPTRTSRLSTRSRMSQRASRMGDNDGGGSGRPHVIVDGKNVTPRPLMGGGKGGAESAHGDDESRSSRMSFESRLAGLERIGSLKSGLMLARGSSASSLASGVHSDPQERQDPLKLAAEHELMDAEDSQALGSVAPLPEEEILTERDLQRLVAITLEESDTFWLFELPSVCVNAESDEGRKVLEANKRYKQLLHDKQQGSDRYTSAELQTMPALQKNQETQCPTVRTAAVGSQASNWDNYDAQEAREGAEDDKEGPRGNLTAAQLASASLPLGTISVDERSAMMSTSGSRPAFMATDRTGGVRDSAAFGSTAMMSTMGGSAAGAAGSTMNMGSVSGMAGGPPRPSASGTAGGAEAAAEALPPVESLGPSLDRIPLMHEALITVEKAVSQNLYHKKLLRYKDVHPSEDLAAAGLPGVKPEVKEGRKSGASDMGERRKAFSSSRNPSRAGSEAGSTRSALRSGEEEEDEDEDEEEGGEGGVIPSDHASEEDEEAPDGRPGGLDNDNSRGFETASFAGSQRISLVPDVAYGAPGLEMLWTFQCAITAGRNITALSWNKVRPDLLAVAYGQCDFFCRGSLPQSNYDRRRSILDAALSITQDTGAAQTGRLSVNKGDGAANAAGGGSPTHGATSGGSHVKTPPPGLICLWSLHNPQWPLWWLETASGITALDFSKNHPTFLAVGMYDGSVAVYDVRDRNSTKPSAVSLQAAGNHSDPVWQVKWVELGDRGEKVISISTDGRVTQWSLTKGLEYNDLMRLKKAPQAPQAQQAAKAGAAPASEGFMSMRSSGLCFDFSWMDSTVYLAGTEEGHVHKCSVSYSEQYLYSYFGHMGPVYSVRWSPFLPSVFLSASADWTVRLWSEEKAEPLLVFQTGKAAVNDVKWCPHNSTVFADVTDSGALEVWDMSLSTLRPVVSYQAPQEGTKFISVLFSDRDPILVAATSSGSVCVFRHEGLARKDQPLQLQSARLEESIKSNLLASDASKGKVQ